MYLLTYFGVFFDANDNSILHFFWLCVEVLLLLLLLPLVCVCCSRRGLECRLIHRYDFHKSLINWADIIFALLLQELVLLLLLLLLLLVCVCVVVVVAWSVG